MLKQLIKMKYEDVLMFIVKNIESLEKFMIPNVVQLRNKIYNDYHVTIRIDLDYSKFHVIYHDESERTKTIDVFRKYVKKELNYYYTGMPSEVESFYDFSKDILYNIPNSNDEWFNLYMIIHDVSEETFINFKMIIDRSEQIVGLTKNKHK